MDIPLSSTKDVQWSFNAPLASSLTNVVKCEATELSNPQKDASKIEDKTSSRIFQEQNKVQSFRDQTQQRVNQYRRRISREDKNRRNFLRNNLMTFLDDSRVRSLKHRQESEQLDDTPLGKQTNEIQKLNSEARTALLTFNELERNRIKKCAEQSGTGTDLETEVLLVDHDVNPEDQLVKNLVSEPFWDQGLTEDKMLRREEQQHLSLALHRWEMFKDRNRIRDISKRGVLVGNVQPSVHKEQTKSGKPEPMSSESPRAVQVRVEHHQTPMRASIRVSRNSIVSNLGFRERKDSKNYDPDDKFYVSNRSRHATSTSVG
eukprot:213306_1